MNYSHYQLHAHDSNDYLHGTKYILILPIHDSNDYLHGTKYILILPPQLHLTIV